MATRLAEKHVAVYNELPPAGGGRRQPRDFRKQPRLRHVPKDDLGRHLLNMFFLHPELVERFARPGATLDEVGKWLGETGESAKQHLLARVERALGIRRDLPDVGICRSG